MADERYLIEGEFPHGSEITVKGTLAGSRIIPEQAEPVVLTAEKILADLQTVPAITSAVKFLFFTFTPPHRGFISQSLTSCCAIGVCKKWLKDHWKLKIYRA